MARILIVEDQADIRRLIRWSLDDFGHDLHEAASGQAALVAALTLQPELVLMDVMMPGAIDGLAACRELKADARYGAPTVVMLTALAQARDRAAGEAAGADAFVTKPFSPAALVDLVGRLLSARGGSERLEQNQERGSGTL